MFRVENLFDCFPHQQIKTNELMPGNIAYIHRNWIFVECGKLEEDRNNNGWNYAILHGTGASYLPPEHPIKIVSRDVLDRNKIELFLTKIKKEQEEVKKTSR